MNQFANKITYALDTPWCMSIAITLLGILMATARGTFSLQNDDLQLYFLLCGGGGDVSPFSIYTVTGYGYLISCLTGWFPGLNWHLAILLAVSVVSCYLLNFSLWELLVKNTGKVVRMAALPLLLYVNMESLSALQYTHIAVMAACTGAILVYNSLCSRFSVFRAIAVVAMFVCAYSLRPQTVVPALFLLMGCVPAAFILTSVSKTNIVRTSASVLAAVLACLTLHAVDACAYRSHPEWQHALKFSSTRMKIQDSADNSGVDKSRLLQQAGIHLESYGLFKGFMYTPQMEDITQVSKARQIHEIGRKGAFGIPAAAQLGLLEFNADKVRGKSTLFQFVTPFVPIMAAGLVVMLYAGKRQLASLALLVAGACAYILALAFLQRMVGRVMNPVLYTTALLAMPLAYGRRCAGRLNCLRTCACAGIMLLACAFCFRHYSPGALFKKGEGDTPLTYCKQHPDTLFLTCCQQGCGLFPTGFTGYTYDYLQKTNIFPIADGWMFYTPAYKSAMQRRGITNPYVTLLDGHTCVVVYKPWDPLATLNAVSTQVKYHTGQEISFRKVHECGVFEFWEPELCATGCP